MPTLNEQLPGGEPIMRVISIYYTHKPGGFCKRLYRLLAALSARGHQVHFLCLERPVQLSNTVNFHRIPFALSARSGALFWLAFTVWAPLFVLWKSLRLKPHGYVVFGAYYATMCLVARVIRPRALVLFLRTMSLKTNRLLWSGKALGLVVSLVDWLGFLSATRIVCLTEAMRADLKTAPLLSSKEILVLPNDVPSAAPSVPRTFFVGEKCTILTSGVLGPAKNIEVLLEAMKALTRHQLSVQPQLLVVGEGPFRSHLESTTLKLGLLNVEFLGWQDDMARLYARADLYVHPSLLEGMPNSVLEALGAHLPILVSDIPELRELATYEELLFAPHNPLALAARLAAFINDGAIRHTVVELSNQRRAALSFDWDERAINAVL